ncbi:MAG: PDZ domain-containing protein [Fimbriimonadaceae bacterium]|nr:MAG: PDZ domain-containing protein [Fimbriimonadaceae bacterium]
MKAMKLRLLRVGVLATLAASTVMAFAQVKDTDVMTPESKADVLAKLERALTSAAFVPGVDFKQWPERVKERKDKIDAAKTVNDFTIEMNSIISNYGFSHIVLFPPSYGVARTTQQRAGIGIRIELEKEGIRVTDIFPESPAAEVGLQAGDLIIESDGKPTRAVADLAGVEGQESNITYMRGTEKRSVKVTRRLYKTVIPETVTWKGDVAVVKIPTFDQGYNAENIEMIMKDVNDRAKGIVLDLRGNGGGRVINLQHLASFFLDRETQPMGTFIGRPQVMAFEAKNGPSKDLAWIAASTPDSQRTRATKNKADILFKIPVSVLVDGGSGSASEIMAAALREQLDAKVYGRKSAGAVLASVIVPLRDESEFWVQFPVTDYITIHGHRLEGNGIVPDVETKPRVFGQPDTAVDMAVAQLKGRALIDKLAG